MKKKIAGISIFIIFLIVILITIRFSFLKIDKVTENNVDNTDNVEIINNNESINMSEIEKAKPFIPDEELDKILFMTKDKLFNFDFEEANKYIEELLIHKKFNDSEKHDKFKRTYTEISLMASFYDLMERGEEHIVKDIIKDFKNPDTFFASIMWLDSLNRKHFIMTGNSINPTFEGGVSVTKKKKLNLNKINNLSEISSRIKNIKAIYEYNFKIDGNDLIAYIVKDADKLHLYKITEQIKGTTHYLTIDEWDNTLKNLKNNFKKQDTSYEIKYK